MRKVNGRFLLALALIAFAGAGARAQEALYDGKGFRVTGHWDGARLWAERVDWREPGESARRGQITGRVDEVDLGSRRLEIGPFRIVWSADTRFEGIDPRALQPGAVVRVNVGEPEGKAMPAQSIEARTEDPGYDSLQIIGRATEGPPAEDGTVQLVILGVPVHLAQDGYNRAKSLTRRQDSRRPEHPVQTELLGRVLTAGGEYSAKLLRRKNFKLEDLDDRVRLDQELKLELYYPLDAATAMFAEVKALHEAELRDTAGTREKESSLERGQAWLYVGGNRAGLQVGRQNFAEVREWWWDDDLDAVRVYFDRGPGHAQLGVAKELATRSTLEKHIDPEDDGILRFFGFGSWLWAPRQRVELFALRHDDRSPAESVGQIVPGDREDASDAHLTWLGFRVIGEPSLGASGSLLYWLDTASVRGGESVVSYDDVSVTGSGGWEQSLSQVTSRADQRVRGYAYDVGLSWATRWALRPTFTLSYAFGSGDGDAQDGVDRSFRQTGLQENKWRFSGVNRFRYYGELLDPELSNLAITTVAVGVPLQSRTSLEIVAHRYRQAKAADFLRDARIDDGLTGDSTDIGNEIDVILGIREARRWELELVAGRFVAGQAFGAAAGKRAWGAFAELTLNF